MEKWRIGAGIAGVLSFFLFFSVFVFKWFEVNGLEYGIILFLILIFGVWGLIEKRKSNKLST